MLPRLLDRVARVGPVLHLLRPGGSWRATEFSVRDGGLSLDEARDYEAVRDGFHLPSLAPPSVLRGALEHAGFIDIEARDLTRLTDRSVAFILARCRLSALLMRLNLDWVAFSRDPRRRANRRGHVRAACAYNNGLRRGYFRYVFLSATKPASSRPPSVPPGKFAAQDRVGSGCLARRDDEEELKLLRGGATQPGASRSPEIGLRISQAGH